MGSKADLKKSLYMSLILVASATNEPPWVCRTPFGLSYAAMAGCSSMA